MVPTVLRKLVALQQVSRTEIEGLHNCLLNKPRNSLNKGIVQARIDALKEIWIEVRKTHYEIAAREDAQTDPYIIKDDFGKLQEVYEKALNEFLTLRAQLEIADEAALRSGPRDSCEAGGGVQLRLAKFPRIRLPTFSGKYEDWESFRDLFTVLVHDVPGVSIAMKLQYLKLCLTGSAADLIKNVTTTSANYNSTCKALKARYHNPRLIIHRHVLDLIALPYLKRESAEELRSFADEAQRIVRALSNLNMPVDHWDVWFIVILSERLDSESHKLWESELSSKDRPLEKENENLECSNSYSSAKFTDLVEFLEKRARTLNMVVSERRAEKRPAPILDQVHPLLRFFTQALLEQLSRTIQDAYYVMGLMRS